MESLQVEVKIELGHKASCKETLTPEGFTHDWVVFVRGPESCDISHFVDKVVFHLHESFTKPKRVLKDPPYQVAEAGYGSFFLPIEVYFKNKEEPRKLRFDYDLFLPVYGSPPIDNIRSEALTFKNPTDEFRRKLVKGGGIVSGLATTNGLSSSSPPGNSIASQHSIERRNGKGANTSMDTQPSTLLPESDKNKKNKHDRVIGSKTAKTQEPVTPGIKRSSSTSGGDDLLSSHSVKKKKKKTEDSTAKPSKPVGFIPLELPTPGSNDKGKLEDVKDIKLKIKSLNKKSSSGSTKKKSKQTSEVQRTNSNTSNNSKLKESSSSKKSKLKSPKEDVKPAKHEEKKVEKITFRRSSGDSWSSSTSASSLSGNASGSKNTALNMLLAEIGDEDDDEDDNEVDIFTPFQHSSLQTSVSQKLSGPAVVSPNSSSKNKDGCKGKPSNSLPTKRTDTAKNGSKNGLKSPTTKSPPAKQSPKIKPKDNKQASNGQHSSTTDLVQLYKRLVALKDSNVLQKVVDIVEASQGHFKITETTLDFDLCLLDKSTIKKIENSVNR